MPQSRHRIHEYKNGFRFVYEPPEFESNICHIKLFVSCGSVWESDKIRGASHFIEHMCFKGTPKHPSTRDIMTIYDNIGAYFNANTNKEYTCYIVKCHNHNFEKCIDLLSDVLLHSSFNKKEFEKEHQVVIEENVKNITDYENESIDLLESKLFEDTAYQYPVDTIKFHTSKSKLQYKDVVEYYRENYVPNRMVLSIVSELPFTTIQRYLNKTDLARADSGCQMENRQTMGLTIYPKIGPTISAIRVAGVDTIYLNIAFRTCGRGNEDVYKLQLLANILGATMTSRVYLLLREDNGLTYTSYVTNVSYSHGGYFTIFAITDSDKIMKNGTRPGVLPLCIDMLSDLKKKGVSKKEIEATKNYMREKAKMNIENEDKMCFYNGHRTLMTDGEFADYGHHYDNILNTSLSEINAIIEKYFQKTNMFLSMVGGGIPSDHALEEVVGRL